jgi:hypothetical protein
MKNFLFDQPSFLHIPSKCFSWESPRDAGYVQGMTDLASPFVPLFITRWIDPDCAEHAFLEIFLTVRSLF